MVTYCLRIFGREIASIEVTDKTPEPPPPPQGMTGGSNHNYELSWQSDEFGFKRERTPVSLPKRVRDNIEFQHSTHPNRTACWIWTGGRTIQDGITNPTPDRYLYEHFRERIPDWKRLRASCPNSSCVNPNHMEIRKGQQ